MAGLESHAEDQRAQREGAEGEGEQPNLAQCLLNWGTPSFDIPEEMGN